MTQCISGNNNMVVVNHYHDGETKFKRRFGTYIITIVDSSDQKQRGLEWPETGQVLDSNRGRVN